MLWKSEKRRRQIVRMANERGRRLFTRPDRPRISGKPSNVNGAKPRFTYSRRQPRGSPAQVVVVNIVPPPVHTQNPSEIFVQIYSYWENLALYKIIFPARVRGTPRDRHDETVDGGKKSILFGVR